ncbi:hypothetical protein DEU56DRAFT_752879 [Suillus clintonianus]|uniref:uncharacterized protein n=1 Tax=Suillus clintonianus TaxID=1904413 RepID=UPI001B87C5B1|nr:uncharacterized protein DEU56DRAFT_752879 [Suillus clintonianus]KAG2149228.1 hypothetical protein DEU56DRAFT_752879 [Suillus clintonianus]
MHGNVHVIRTVGDQSDQKETNNAPMGMDGHGWTGTKGNNGICYGLGIHIVQRTAEGDNVPIQTGQPMWAEAGDCTMIDEWAEAGDCTMIDEWAGTYYVQWMTSGPR